MTEAELVLELGLNLERGWGMVQWWVSITFAVLLAAHLGAKYLNNIFVSIIVVLYSLLSFVVAQVFLSYMRMVFASARSLKTLSEQVELSGVGNHLISGNSSLLGVSLWITLLLTFLMTNFYVVYSFRKNRDVGRNPQLLQESGT